jgi:hypothetical protein
MRKFKGWSKHKVYAPDKPIKRGLKHYVGVDSIGYCFFVEMYRNVKPKSNEKTRELLNNIMDVLSTNNDDYIIYYDNYYGSVDAANDALLKGFKFTFGCHTNQPTALFQSYLHKNLQPQNGINQVAYLLRDDYCMGAIAWKDRKIINFLSNIYLNSVVTVKEKKDQKLVNRVMPKVRDDYN